MLTEKSILFVFVTTTLFLFNIVTVCGKKSLFDDLPLNGAYSPTDINDESLKLDTAKLPDFAFPKRVDKNKIPEASANSDSESNEESLFDQMPNKGALPLGPGDLNTSESSDQIRSFLAPKLLIRSDLASNGVQFEVERQIPTEFNLADFNNNKFPSIVQSLTGQEAPHTIYSPIVQQQRGPGPLILSHPLPLPRTDHGQESYPSRGYPSNSNVFQGGIPVIGTNSDRQAHSLARNPSIYVYGSPSPSPAVATQRETITNKEVYHHYHFKAPRRTHFQKYARNLNPPKVNEPSTYYGNPQRTGTISGGYGYGQHHPLPSFTTTTTTTTTTPRPQGSDGSIFPIITGDHLNDPVSGDYDYETLENKPNRPNQQFSSRTGSGSFSVGFGVGEPSSSHRNSFNNEPQQHFLPPQVEGGYGPPTPPPSYGPPPQDPAPSYGPPPADTLQPIVEPPAPPPGQSTTSISYQTIPIQTVHTQLVTVPHVTISASSSTSESDPQSEGSLNRPQRPNRPANTAYGPPGLRTSFAAPPRGGQPVGSLFTDDQIGALLSVARGSGSVNQFADNTDETLASLLTGVLGGGNGNILGVGNLLGGRNILGDDLGFQLGGSRSILPNIHNLNQNRFRNNVNSNDQLLAALINQGRHSEGFLPKQNRFALPGRGLRGGPILTGDAVDAVSDLIREQKLRSAVSELSGQLYHQNRNAQRVNEKYKSLFYKGALLLSALTLIPAVASPFAAAANSAAATNSFLLPLATGRRKRDIEFHSGISPFENCKWFTDNPTNSGSNLNSDLGSKVNNTFGFNGWFNCALNATETVFEENSSESIADGMHFKGALLPENIRQDLKNTISPEEIIKNSKCLQKRFCETLLEVKTLSNTETFLFLHSLFASDVEANPWIRESMKASRNKNCEAFFCFEDYNNLLINGLMD